jgi:hypothetical protein
MTHEMIKMAAGNISAALKAGAEKILSNTAKAKRTRAIGAGIGAGIGTLGVGGAVYGANKLINSKIDRMKQST